MSEILIENFISATGAPRSIAEQFLARNNYVLIEAVEDYKENGNFGPSSGSSSSSSIKKKSSNTRGVSTLRDLNNDDDEDDKTNTNFFTGGEKSALQVEDPNNRKKKGGEGGQSLVDQIFQKAKEQMGLPDDRPSAADDDEDDGKEKAPKFSGSGFKLGDGILPSTEIKDPNSSGAGSRKVPAKVTREIIFWRQGFTVSDGPLHRYDDPENTAIMEELNRGRVPMSLLDVEFGQDVDVSVFRKTDEDWTPPKRNVGGYHGQGQRLGSPVPGEVSVASETPALVEVIEDSTKIPEDEGDSPVQIRFANGKKVSQKFNSNDSITKVYEFVRQHPFSHPGRKFILSHSFPVKPIEENDETTVAQAKLKNAVIVQRWV